MFGAVNGIDRIQVVFHGIVYRIFPGLQGKTLMTHILKSNDLPADFFLRKLLAGDMLIFHVIRTVGTSVDTVVGQI